MSNAQKTTDFQVQKGKRRSQRSFLESLSIAKQPTPSGQSEKNKNEQYHVHIVDSQYGFICSYSVSEMQPMQPLDISEKNYSKNQSCSLQNPFPSVILTSFIVDSLNTKKFKDFTLDQIPGYFEASAAIPSDIKISDILDIKHEIWDFSLEHHLQISTVLISFSLLDRLLMLHQITEDYLEDAAWSSLYISSQINEENLSKAFFDTIIDETPLTKKVFFYIEAIVFLKLNCKMLPSNEEYTAYDMIAKPAFQMKK